MQSTGIPMLKTVCILTAVAASSLAIVSLDSASAQPVAEVLAATASSQWGPGYGADAAVDGIANENGNYWQTVAKEDRGAWWQVDLGQVVPVRAVQIAWARYQDKYHSTPARMIVQLSNTGADGPWQDVLIVRPDKIPADETPFDPERSWRYPFPEAVPGRFVRLFFPDGDQPHAKYDGYICLGEVQVDAPGLAPELVSIEAAFGKVEVNVTRPSLPRLYLRGSGELAKESLLAVSGPRQWARGACTYVVAEDGRRYESRLAKPENVEVSSRRRPHHSAPHRREARFRGRRAAGGHGGLDPLRARRRCPFGVEDQTPLERDFTAVSPAVRACSFPSMPGTGSNSTTSTFWYDPLRIAAGESKLYALVTMPGRVSENHLQTIRTATRGRSTSCGRTGNCAGRSAAGGPGRPSVSARQLRLP